MTTQIVILAAGMGSRLGRSLPKPLTELSDGRTIMRQQFDNIEHAFGPKPNVTIVVGYKLEHIIEAFPQASFVYNEEYDQTNTSKSLMRALQASQPGGVLWMTGDVVFALGLSRGAVQALAGSRQELLRGRGLVEDLRGLEDRREALAALACLRRSQRCGRALPLGELAAAGEQIVARL